MTLLEKIIKASANPDASTKPLKYPIDLDSDSIIHKLKPTSENPDQFSFVQPLDGFKISDPDSAIIDSNSKFFSDLKRKLKDPKAFSRDSQPFMLSLNSFLEKLAKQRSLDVDVRKVGGASHTAKLLEKFGFLVGRDVKGLLIEVFILLEQWPLLETLIVNKLVDYGSYSNFLRNLIAKRQSNLVCLCLRHFSDVKASDLGRVLKYFLSPSKDAILSMTSVREEWKSDALLAIQKVANGKTLELAKDASILLMMAYDIFSSPELCMHFLLALNVDEVVFASAISKLNAEEMLNLIRYLGKWLKKYERFPQAISCPTAETELGLKMCKWVPKLEDVVRCLGLVVDEHFASLALHSEFHQKLKEIDGIVSSLVMEGRVCCSIANAIEVLKPEV